MKCAEKWQIKLKAEQSLLEKLCGEFCDPKLHIFHDSDGWFLESTRLDSDESSKIYEEGERLIGFLNQMLWLSAYRLNPIESDGYYLLTGSGERINKFSAFGQPTLHTRLIVYSNDIPDCKSFYLFLSDKKVEETLALFNNQELDWNSLYKIYETVRDDKPSSSSSNNYKPLIEKGWGLKEGDWKRFRDTANYSHRHSVHKNDSKKPDNTMSFQEARKFIRQILIAWLKDKSTIKGTTQSSQ